MSYGQLWTPEPYYYRNATRVILTFGESILGPHGFTTRLSTTIPAGRSAFVESVDLALLRVTVAGTAGGVMFYLTLAGVRAVNLQLGFINTVAGDQVRFAQTPRWLMASGEVLTVTSGSFDTGGTVLCVAQVGLTLFDAL